jgi:hypothetical protein
VLRHLHGLYIVDEIGDDNSDRNDLPKKEKTRERLVLSQKPDRPGDGETVGMTFARSPMCGSAALTNDAFSLSSSRETLDSSFSVWSRKSVQIKVKHVTSPLYVIN